MRALRNKVILCILLIIWLLIAPCRMMGGKPIIRIYQSYMPAISIGVEQRESISFNVYYDEEEDVVYITHEYDVVEEGKYTHPWITEGPIRLVYEGEIQEDYSVIWKTEEPEAYILAFFDRLIVVNHSSRRIYFSGNHRFDDWGDGKWSGGFLGPLALGTYTRVVESGDTLVIEYTNRFDQLRNYQEGHYLLAVDYTYESNHLDDPYYWSEDRYWICETEFDYWP